MEKLIKKEKECKERREQLETEIINMYIQITNLNRMIRQNKRELINNRLEEISFILKNYVSTPEYLAVLQKEENDLKYLLEKGDF